MLAAVGIAGATTADTTGSIAAATVEPTDYLRIEAWPPVRGGSSYAGRWTIFLDGYIDPRASGRLGGLIAERGIRKATVYFNSPGGSLLAGMEIGQLLRDRGYDARIGARAPDAPEPEPRPGVCYSACPFAFAGGVRRYLDEGSVIGVHRAGNRVPVKDEAAFDRRVTEQATRYLASMGVSQALFVLMEEVPQEQIRVLTFAEAERLKLVNGGVGRP